MCVEEGCALLGRGGCGGGRGVSVRVTVASISNQYYRYMGSAPTQEHDSRGGLGERGGGDPGLSCCGSKIGGVCDVE